MKKWIFLIAALMIVLAGCTGQPALQSNERFGCCDPFVAEEDDRCELAEAGDGMEVIDTDWCDVGDGALNVCNVTLEIHRILEDGSEQVQQRDETLALCTRVEGQPDLCLQPQCVAQVCGPFTYRPQTIISHQDTVDLQEELEEGDRSDVPAEDEPDVRNLYGSSCLFIDMDENFSRVFDNTKESIVNTFRFGIGESFGEFERYRQMFPFTDAYCNVNPVPDAKDRFANYFRATGEDIEAIEQRMQDVAYCPTTFQSPFRNDLYGDTTDAPNYNFERVVAIADGEVRMETDDFDRKFYDHTLRWLYRDEFGQVDTTNEPTPARFECSGAPECKSQNCDITLYKRGVCRLENDQWVDCDCYNGGRECGGETVYTANVPGVNSLEQAIDRYNDGGELYVRTPRTVQFYYQWWDPNCEGAGEEYDDDVKYCELRNGVYGCWTVNEPSAGGSSSNRSQVQARGAPPQGDWRWDELENNAAHFNCTRSGGTVNCRSIDNPASTFQFYPGPSEGGTIRSIQASPDPNSIKLNCPTGVTSSDPFLCDAYAQVPAPMAESDEDVVRSFPPHIYLFGSGQRPDYPDASEAGSIHWEDILPDREYIGFTLLSPDEFEKTNFYQGCGLTESDYYTVTMKPYFNWDIYQFGENYYWAYTKTGRIEAAGENGGHWWAGPLDGTLTRTPPPMVQGRAVWRKTGAQCHWNGDDNGRYYYARYILYIEDAGDCQVENGKLDNRVFGWCEGCNYLTLAQHEIETSEPYENLEEERYRGGSDEPYSTTVQCAETPFTDGPICILNHPDKPDPELRTFNSPLDQEPESVFLLERQIKYLKEGVLPVLDVSDSSNWNRIDEDVIVRAQSLLDDGIEATSNMIRWAEATRADTVGMPPIRVGAGEDPAEGGSGDREASGTGTEEEIDSGQFVEDSMNGMLPPLRAVRQNLTEANDNIDDMYRSSGEQNRRGELGQAMSHIEQATDVLQEAKSFSVGACNLFRNPATVNFILEAQEDAQSGVDSEDRRFIVDHLPLLCSWMYAHTDEGFIDLLERGPTEELLFQVQSLIAGELQRLEDGIEPSGPSIVIVHTVNERMANASTANEIKLRASIVKSICGRCQIAVAIQNGAAGSRDGEERRELYESTLAQLASSGGGDMMTLIDGFAIGFYPHEYAQENPVLCQRGGEALYTKMIDELQAYGEYTRSDPYRKYVLVNKMFIDRSVEPQCWEAVGDRIIDDPMFKTLSRFAFRQRTLTQAGVVGIIYSDVDQLEETVGGQTRYTDQFCTLERAARLFVADPPITVYKRIPLKEQVFCQECTPAQRSLGQCSRTCGNGLECQLPDGVPTEEEDIYGCSVDDYPTEETTWCRDIDPDKMVQCTLTHSDGRVETLRVPASQLDAGYPDVIASLPHGYRCTLNDPIGNYTFSKVEIKGKALAPVVYTYSDDASGVQDCGFPDPNVAPPGQCGGAELPVKSYSITCEYEDGLPEWPPRNQNIVVAEIADG